MRANERRNMKSRSAAPCAGRTTCDADEKAIPIYACPFYNACVSSTVRAGHANHRQARGNFFAVREGKVAVKGCAYCCPWCKATVSSNVKTELVDHRTVCGSQFRVKDGVVNSGQAPVQACSSPGDGHQAPLLARPHA